MTSDQDSELFSYEPFTRHPFYIEINRTLVQQALNYLPAASQGQPIHIVDLACGTGMISELAVQEVARLKRPAQIIALDSSADALQRAAERLAGAPVTFLQSDLTNLTETIKHADLIFFCNAIHLIPEKPALLTRLFRLLSPGGVLACNTTFFDGAYVPGTERCYRLTIRGALEFLRRNYPGMRPSRQEGGATMEWLTADGYIQILEAAGFHLLATTLQQAEMPPEAWQDIASYSEFIKGALPGIPLKPGALALRAGAERVFQELNVSFVPRSWLQLIARAT